MSAGSQKLRWCYGSSMIVDLTCQCILGLSLTCNASDNWLYLYLEH